MDRSGGGKLIIVCGLPGSGKTTHSKELERSLSAIRLCPDEWMNSLHINLWDESSRARIEALQWKLAQELLRLGQVVIIEWGVWKQSERDALRIGARNLGASVELHYLAGTSELLFERISRRGTEKPPVTREQVENWMNVFQVPTSEELALFDEPSA